MIRSIHINKFHLELTALHAFSLHPLDRSYWFSSQKYKEIQCMLYSSYCTGCLGEGHTLNRRGSSRKHSTQQSFLRSKRQCCSKCGTNTCSESADNWWLLRPYGHPSVLAAFVNPKSTLHSEVPLAHFIWRNWLLKNSFTLSFIQ